MVGSRGQSYAVLKILQGAVLAVVMLTIVYGIIHFAEDRRPSSDIYSVSCELLSSAYAARGTGEHFTRQALLVEQEVSSSSLVQCSGLPAGTTLNLLCKRAFCIHSDEQVTETGECGLYQPCFSMRFVAGDMVPVCATCTNDGECNIWFGEKEC